MQKTIITVIALCLLNAGQAVFANPAPEDIINADINGDNKVDFQDYAAVVENWEITDCNDSNNWCECTDINHSGFVGLDDIQIMAESWLEGVDYVQTDVAFVTIPAGTFQMGDSFSDDGINGLPVHTVTLSSYMMSQYEITNGQYCDFLNSAYPAQIKEVGGVIYAVSDTGNNYPYFDTRNDSRYVLSQVAFSGCAFSVRSKGGRSMVNDPVVEVGWYGAKAFCDYYDYRLPTEAEWEYAARGGLSGRRFPWGDTINHSYANYMANGSLDSYDTSSYTINTFHPTWNDGIDPYTSPVGSFSANGYGLYDMTGNVWELCSDWIGKYPSSPQVNPTGPATGYYRVLRGGSYYYNAVHCRVALRVALFLSAINSNIGFRVCMD